MVKTVLGFRRGKTKKGSDMIVLHCAVPDDRVEGGTAVEQVFVFGNVTADVSSNMIGKQVDVDYRIDGTSAFVSGVKLIK